MVIFARNVNEMKKYICSEWIAENAFDEGRVERTAFNDDMSVVKLHGKDVFKSGLIKNLHHTSLFVTNGKVHFTTRGESIVVSSPAYIEFIAFYRHVCLQSDNEFEGYLLVTEQSLFQRIAEDTRSVFSRCMYKYGQKPILSLDDSEMNRILPFIAILFNTIDQKDHCFMHGVIKNTFIAMHFEIWNIIFRKFKNETSNDPVNHWNDVLSHFLYLMHANCCRQHEVGWYASKLCVSANTLSVKLKRVYGKSASQLINECVMEEAKIYLRNPSNSVQKVAEKLSFSDQAAFYKFFKRLSGMSPSEFQKSLKK